MQLSIDMTIQPGFTQHRVQRALYSLWQARCQAGQIPLWSSLLVTYSAPSYLKPVSLASLTQTDVLIASPARR